MSWPILGGRPYGERMIRAVEVLAELSLTTDLASGVPFEKGLQTCVLATAFAARLDVPVPERSTVFHAALSRSIGCTAHAPENAASSATTRRSRRRSSSSTRGRLGVRAQAGPLRGMGAGPAT